MPSWPMLSSMEPYSLVMETAIKPLVFHGIPKSAGAKLQGINFLNVPLSPSVSFKGCDLRNANLAGKDLQGIDISGATLSNSVFIGTNLIQFYYSF